MTVSSTLSAITLSLGTIFGAHNIEDAQTAITKVNAPFSAYDHSKLEYKKLTDGNIEIAQADGGKWIVDCQFFANIVGEGANVIFEHDKLLEQGKAPDYWTETFRKDYIDSHKRALKFWKKFKKSIQIDVLLSVS